MMKMLKLSAAFMVLVAVFIAGPGPAAYAEDSDHVESADVPNTPRGGGADLKGMSKEDIDYFKDLYPPDYWVPPSHGGRIGVGPVLLSREALFYLESGKKQSISKKGATEGRDLYYLDERQSFEAQGVIVEGFSEDGTFDVYTLDQKACYDLYKGNRDYPSLVDEGIKYYVNGNMTVAPGNGEVRVYLRFTDTLTKQVICTASAKGARLDDTTRAAAGVMLERLKAKIK